MLVASRPSGEWNDDDFDVVADGVVVGRIMKAAAAPVGVPWLWTHPVLRRSSADARLRGEARGRDGGVREELAKVRFRGQTGKHVLILSLTAFDPSGHSLDLPIGLSTDRAMEAWYDPSTA